MNQGEQGDKMTKHQGNAAASEVASLPPRPPSSASTASTSSSTSSSKHVKCIGRYLLTGTTLGKGNFARVEAAVHTLTQAKVAIKVIETDKIKEEYVRKNLLREAMLMRRLRHPNVIRLYETMKTNALYCLVTEIAEGGELLSHVRNDFREKRLPESNARPFIRQLVSALSYLHSQGIVHRDLKMENILLDKRKRNVKIVDFGLSNSHRPGALLSTHCGSPEYAAPELFIPGREYGPEVDVWSLGVNLYAMLVGKLPFRSPRQGTKRRQKLLEQIAAGLSDNHFKEMFHLTASAQDLVGKLLQPDPQQRVKLDEVMKHPWITKDGLYPLHPYKAAAPDPSAQQAVMELMAAVLEVSMAEIKETVKRDRCDWLAAIYNLLIDQPEGRIAMNKLLCNAEKEASEMSSGDPFDGSSSGFSQNFSQETLHEPVLTNEKRPTSSAAGGIAAHNKLTYRLSTADSDRYYQQQEMSSLPAPTKKTRHLSEKQQHVSSLSRQIPPSSALPLALKDRRNSNHAGLTSPDDYPPQTFKGRKLPPTPTGGAMERPSTVRSRTESAPDPLPPPFQPKLAAPKDHHYGNLVLHTPPESPVDYGHYPHQQFSDSGSEDHRHSFGPSKRKGQLDPLVPRTYTSAREMSPGGVKESGNLRRNKAQIVPQSKNELMENGGTPTIGWGSNKNLVTSKRHSSSHQSVFGMAGKSDIQSLMDSPMNYQMQSVERLNTLGATSPIHATGLAWSSGHNIKGLDLRNQETSPPPGQVSSPFHPKQKLLTSKDSPKLNNEVVRNELSLEGPAQSFKRTRSTSAKARPHTVHVTQPALQSKATKSTKNLSLYNGEQIPNNYRKSEYYDYYNTSTEQLPEIDTRPGSGKGKRATTKGLGFGGFLGKALKISSFKGDVSSKP